MQKPLVLDFQKVTPGLRPALLELASWVGASEAEAGTELPHLREVLNQVEYCWSLPHVTEDRVKIHLAWYGEGVFSTDDMLGYLDAYVTSTGDSSGCVTISNTDLLIPFATFLRETHGVVGGTAAIAWAREGGKYEAQE